MVAPGWVADIEGSWAVLGEELSDDSEGTSAREGLHGGDASVTNEWAVPAEEDALGSLAELSETIDGKVLLVEAGISNDSLLCLSDDWEDVGLAIVVTVSTDTKVDLLWVLISLVASRKGQDWVGRGHWHVSELVVQGSDSLHFVLLCVACKLIIQSEMTLR